MASFNLGNYGGQLSIDDYNRALANGGSGYRLQEPAAAPVQQGNQFDPGTGANPYATEPTMPVQQASDRERPPEYAGGKYYGGRHSDVGGSGSMTMPYGSNKKDDGQSKLGNVLGLVGKIAAFL